MASEEKDASLDALGGANILPIPPALEFPFPQAAVDDEDAPRFHKVPHPATVPVDSLETKEDPPLATPSLQKIDTHPRPAERRRMMSDRAMVSQRISFLRMKRNQTGYTPTSVAAVAGASSSTDDLASTDDDSVHTKGAHVKASRTKRAGKGLEAHEEDSSADDAEERFRKFVIGNGSYESKGCVSRRDGRLNISLKETGHCGYLANTLDATLKHHLRAPEHHRRPRHKSIAGLKPAQTKQGQLIAELSSLTEAPTAEERPRPPPMDIVVMVIGSRGDIQPFLKIGKVLKEKYGHRVRVATHPAFKDFIVQDSGLEFFSVGGDPAELMAFMVKNPGLMPSLSTLKTGEVGRRRDSMFEMFQGFWRACINATDGEQDASNRKMMSDAHPFLADAIIANPPSFAHVHCAERLGIPLHIMFTFPYTPTQQFPHPLANIKQSNIESNYANFMSYPLVEMMTWQGLGDLINRFRVKTLGIEPVSTLWAPGQLFRQKVPYTYMWSPDLIPKPKDWGPEIDIAGFVFLALASSFQPPDSLSQFLENGEAPVYIGFGSIVVDDPDKFTALIFSAIEKAGVRALVSKGWGGLGHQGHVPDNIYLLENTPHDWLFPRCAAVVHHGGAGTTAIGLKCGKPTMIVPFFGDQPFWGSMVAKAGAGASEAIPFKQLTVDTLAEGIRQCLTPDAKAAARGLADSIAKEGDGAENAVESFHRHLPLNGERSMRCSILPDRVAAWKLKRSHLRLSPLAASLLVQERKLKWSELKLVRHRDWNDFAGPGEPITGGGTALMQSVGEVVKGVGGVPIKWAKSIKKEGATVHEERQKSRSLAKAQTNAKSSSRNADDERSKAANDGELGKESRLPQSHALLGRARTHVEQELAPVHGGSLHPAPSNHQEGETAASSESEHVEHHLLLDLIEETSGGICKSGEALIKAPMDLALAVAQGFHNAPRLYGDSTVRPAPRITGIHSGLRAAGSEFTLGIYDGVTGLVSQPYHGARDHGAMGFVQGMGKGFGGFILKDLAAIIAPFGYTLKGVHKEIVKSKQPTALIRKARVTQGTIDSFDLKDGRREEVLGRVKVAWKIVSEIRKEDEAERQEGVRRRLSMARDHHRRKSK